MTNVQILNVAHAFISGARGDAGGSPSKDSVFGLALIQGNLVSFSGRRGGVLRFKTYKKAEMTVQRARFEKKLTGNPFGKDVAATYELLTGVARDVMLPGFAETVGKGFYTAMANKKLNTYKGKECATGVSE